MTLSQAMTTNKKIVWANFKCVGKSFEKSNWNIFKKNISRWPLMHSSTEVVIWKGLDNALACFLKEMCNSQISCLNRILRTPKCVGKSFGRTTGNFFPVSFPSWPSTLSHAEVVLWGHINYFLTLIFKINCILHLNTISIFVWLGKEPTNVRRSPSDVGLRTCMLGWEPLPKLAMLGLEHSS